MAVNLGETTRIEHIINLIDEFQDRVPGTLLTHTFVWTAIEHRYGVSGTLVRKYIRHAIRRGLLTELRPSYDGSIGAVEIITGNPVYITSVKSDARYALVSEPSGADHQRQLALIGTPECVRSVLAPFIHPEILRHHDCG